jgi:hypothetical protein
MGSKWYWWGADELLEDICISTKRQTQENSTKKVRKLGKLHMYDCLRKKFSMGIEGRVPF